MLIGVNGLKKSFGDNLLFDSLSFEIEKGDIIGLIGENGCGKTTLFRILSGEETYDAGGVVRRGGATVGVLNQHACAGSVKSAYDEALTTFSELLTLEKEIEEVNIKLETVADSSLIARQHSLNEKFEASGGLTFRSRTAAALSGLGLSAEEQRLSVSLLSGGQRSKVELCKLLLAEPDVILLDEPTNHLDIDAIEWLDGYIRSVKSAVMIISHDRFFLDRVANKIFEIDSHKLYSCNGNYTKYCSVRELRRESVARNYDNTMREVERIERIIEQQRRWNREKNIKTAENKQKMIDRLLSDLEIPESEKENMCLSFTCGVRSGDEVLSAVSLTAQFGESPLYSGVDIDIRRGERVFIIGPNGCGKTTLLRQLLDRSKACYGAGVSVGYFDQHQRNLTLTKTVFEELRDAYPTIGNTALRSALAMFLFKGDDVYRKVEALSGGERSRVALCMLMLAHDNLLFLDEPTNHLDIESREILEKALSDYDGTILCVSHDRYFINRLATSVMYFEDGKLISLKGNYDTYLACRVPEVKSASSKKDSAAKLGYIRKKQDAAELRRLKSSFRKAESKIAETEDKIRNINDELGREEIISDYEKVTALTAEAEMLNLRLGELMEEWERLGSKLEESNEDALCD